MRSIHVIAGLAASSGGPSYSVPRLRRALAGVGVGTSLLTLRSPCGEPVDPFAETYPQLFASVPVLSRLRLSPGLKRRLDQCARSNCVVHNHGLWLMPNVDAGHVAAKLGRPLVVSPRGMLAPEALRFSRTIKHTFWALLQGPALAKAAAWHATSEEEADDIRAFGISAPVAVIPNGIDLPKLVSDHNPSRKRRRVLFLSRLHPKKGLPNLIAAWSRIAPERPDWDLVIAGPDECGHRAELEFQSAQISTTSIHFTGPIYGSRKDALLSGADLFVLPTHSENFGIVVAEALAMGVPAIVTKGAPWAGLNSERCGWWIDKGADALACALHEAMALSPEQRRAMGARGRAWMQRDFSWDRIAKETAAVYRWLHRGGSPPPNIRHD